MHVRISCIRYVPTCNWSYYRRTQSTKNVFLVTKSLSDIQCIYDNPGCYRLRVYYDFHFFVWILCYLTFSSCSTKGLGYRSRRSMLVLPYWHHTLGINRKKVEINKRTAPAEQSKQQCQFVIQQ